MTFKDYFSGHAQAYANARPGYPDALFKCLSGLCPQHRLAWDCATGNAQAAHSLAGYFANVLASDASADQLAAAKPADRINLCVASAESVPLVANSTDLVTVAQALHWFDIDRFFSECDRVLSSAGVLAVWSYDFCQVDAAVDALTMHLYSDVLGDYWPVERRLVETRYRGIKFPFSRLDVPQFRMRLGWRRAQFEAYLYSWSAAQRYRRERQADPVALIQPELAAAWPDGVEKKVEWPLTVIVCCKQASSAGPDRANRPS